MLRFVSVFNEKLGRTLGLQIVEVCLVFQPGVEEPRPEISGPRRGKWCRGRRWCWRWCWSRSWRRRRGRRRWGQSIAILVDAIRTATAAAIIAPGTASCTASVMSVYRISVVPDASRGTAKTTAAEGLYNHPPGSVSVLEPKGIFPFQRIVVDIAIK